MIDSAIFSLSFKMPEDWDETYTDNQKMSRTFAPPEGGILYAALNTIRTNSADADSYILEFIDSLDRNGIAPQYGGLSDVTYADSVERSSMGDAVTYYCEFKSDDGEGYIGKSLFVLTGRYNYSLTVAVPEGCREKYAGVIDDILDSATGVDYAPEIVPLESAASSEDGDSQNDVGASSSDDVVESMVIGDGTYRVGVDIEAGEYKLTADTGTSGYWKVTDSSAPDADIVGNDIFEGNAYVTVTEGQYLKLNRCSAEKVS